MGFLRICIVAALATVVTACGGGGSADDTGGASKDAEPVDRAGYFTEDESEQLNPALTTWNEVSDDYYASSEECTAEAERKFKDGATPRAAVACHLRGVGAMIDAIANLEAVVGSLDGAWREPCTKQIEQFTEFLAEHRAAWETLRGDWQAYASGKPTPQIAAHSKAADATNATFVEDMIPAISEGCYTEADRAQG